MSGDSPSTGAGAHGHAAQGGVDRDTTRTGGIAVPVPGPQKPTLRVGAFFAVDGRVLMVEQSRGDERYWLLPGGGVRFGESLAQALIREVREELGLRVAVGPLLAIVESISPEAAYPKHVVHLIFDVSAAKEADIVPREATVLGARFLSETDLQAADVRPPVTEFLAGCLRERPSSPQYLGRRW